jgi:hypothetical protein
VVGAVTGPTTPQNVLVTESDPPRTLGTPTSYGTPPCRRCNANSFDIQGAIFDGRVTGVGREQDGTNRYPEAQKVLRNRP